MVDSKENYKFDLGVEGLKHFYHKSLKKIEFLSDLKTLISGAMKYFSVNALF